jgi:undecaprenyl-diphosphatase UppP
MTIIEAVTLGVVQGLTEFLPISSTAHLRIVPAVFGWDDPGAAYSAVIQCGTLLAVCLALRHDIVALLRGLAAGLRSGQPLATPESRAAIMVALGTLPIVAVGFGCRHLIRGEARRLEVVTAALFAATLLMAGAELLCLWRSRRGVVGRSGLEAMTFVDGLTMGLAQVLALVPGTSRSGGTRPSGPNRHGSKQAAAADASWKVGVSETTSGQVVTGTQANRSTKTTGNEASTCRSITGTEYMGADIFRTFCQSEPVASQPAKVRVTATSHGNQVTGNEVGRSDKVTGDEPGTCKNVTGTEYVSANQSAAYCGTSNLSPRKVGRGQTRAGLAVSGVMVGRSEKVTGDEPGSGKQLTGTQYVGDQSQLTGRAPTKVSSLNTLRGTGITGTHVGRSEHVTGDEPGSCRLVTGDEYVGSQQYDRFCGTKPAPEAAKVGFSVTNRAIVVSGTHTGRSGNVTGDEPGTCKVVTGTPYTGFEQAGEYCSNNQVAAIRQRTPVRGANRMSGIQPGIGGSLTGADRGACESITGTPYLGADQMAQACGAASASDADFPNPLAGSQPWQQFSIQSPARAAHTAHDRAGAVTGTSYEKGNRVTGPFDLAGDKVTGTEQFRFDRRGAQLSRGPIAVVAAPVSVDEDVRPTSRVTGEGISAGLKITGDDWDRGDRVTGTEGVSARRRNPTRTGPMSAMAAQQPKRNEEVPEPVSRVTGSSGNTSAGSLITVSGGARG